MRSSFFFFLCLLIILSVTANKLIWTILRIATSVAIRYQPTCVYTLYTIQEWTDVVNSAELFKALAINEILTATISLQQLIHVFNVSNCIPLFIIPAHIMFQRHLQQLSRLGMMSRGKWILFLNSTISVQEYFANIYVPVDCEFLVTREAEDSGFDVTLVEVYWPSSSAPLQVHPVANWSATRGMLWTSVTLFNRRKDLHGVFIKAAMIHDPPFISIAKREGRKPKSFSGYAMKFWNLFAERMNFTLDPVIPKDGAHGLRKKNGTWTGIVGMVMTRDVEVGLNLMTISKDRLQAVDYIHPICNTKVIVYIREQEFDYSSLNQVIAPFNTSLWIAVAVSILILSTLISTTKFINSGFNKFAIADSTIQIICIFCQKSLEGVPKKLPLRLLYVTSHLLSLALFVVYSATFISHLSVRRNELPFTDFQGLLDDGTYEFGVTYGSAHQAFLKYSKDPIIQKVYHDMVAPNRDKLPRSTIAGLIRTCENDKYSFFCSEAMARGLSQELPCEITQIPDTYYRISLSVTINKMSPYKIFFNHLLLRLGSSGIIERIDRRFWPVEEEDLNPEDYVAATMDEVLIIYTFWSIGLILSFLMLIVELLCHYWNTTTTRARNCKITVIRVKNESFFK